MWKKLAAPSVHPVAVLAAVAALAFGVCVAEAGAGAFTVRVVAPQTVVVGKPIVIRAAGTIPAQYFRYHYWVSVVSIRTSVLKTCPASAWDAKQVANATGGAILVLSTRAAPDPSGRFVVPVGIRPYAPGTARICAYVDDGEARTLAAGSKRVSVRRAGR